MVTTSVAPSLKSRAVFTAPIVPRVSYVASPITRFVRVKVIECRRSAFRQRSYITMMGIETVIDVAVETVRAMEPWASSDEDATAEPVRPVVAIGSAAVWRVIEVPVGAYRRDSDINGNLSRCYGHTTHYPDSESTESK